jgi:glucokinase
MQSVCLAYDIGGTKVALGVIDQQGQIHESKKISIDLELGPDHFLQTLTSEGQHFLQKYPSISTVGISSCGPLDPKKGLLLDPTNLLTQGKGWGVIPIREKLTQSLQRKVILENDAACSVLAEQWLGVGKQDHCDNILMLTLGTGLGVGVLCNGQLIRGGRHYHPEAGHLIIDYKDPNTICACGVAGDAEGYLSGKNFEKYYQQMNPSTLNLNGSQITALARQGNQQAKAAFAHYAQHLAVTLHNFCVMFYPEIVVFCGSFAEAFSEFAELTQQHLQKLLRRREGIMPKLMVSSLDNKSSILGAARLCF